MHGEFRLIPDYERIRAFARRMPAMDPEALMAFAAVHAIGTEMETALGSYLARYETTSGRLRVMGILLEQERPLTHSEVAELSGVTKGTVTGLVDGLERDGLVERRPDSEDRRVIKIVLTRSGRAWLDRILPDHLARLTRAMSGLTKREQKTLVALMKKVHKGLPALTE